MRADCFSCRKPVTLHSGNCVVHAYAELPWMAWMQYSCGCGYQSERWLAEGWAGLLEAFTNKTQIGFINELRPSEQIIQEFDTKYHTTTPIARELPPTLARLVASFQAVLEAIPDGLLWDELTHDNNRPYPERWV